MTVIKFPGLSPNRGRTNAVVSEPQEEDAPKKVHWRSRDHIQEDIELHIAARVAYGKAVAWEAAAESENLPPAQIEEARQRIVREAVGKKRNPRRDRPSYRGVAKNAEHGSEPSQGTACQGSRATDVACQRRLSPARERSKGADRIGGEAKHEGRGERKHIHETFSPWLDERILG